MSALKANKMAVTSNLELDGELIFSLRISF